MTTGNADASVPDAGAAPGDPRRGLRQEPGRSERIARAAREIFARDGLNVGYNEVARAAGVGVGTVYRRYPTREALIVAAVGASHDQLAEIAADALATADPWEALVTFLERGLDLLSGNLGYGTSRLAPIRPGTGLPGCPIGSARSWASCWSGRRRPVGCGTASPRPTCWCCSVR